MMSSRGIALVGSMGAGKTTVGRSLAHRLGWRFVDLDEVMVRAHGPISGQFEQVGESGFRERERCLLASVAAEQTVLAVGGGTSVDPSNRGDLERRFRSVWLDVPLETAARRIGSGRDRPLASELSRLWEQRQPVYASARSRVDASGAPDAVAELVLAAVEHRIEAIQHAGGSYDVVIRHDFAGLAGRLSEGDVVVVSDTTVAPLWNDDLALDPDPILFVAGEASKHLRTWSAVLDAMVARRVRRDTSVVALGGGVVGDLAGFAAATLNRGCPLVQVPTTTLAMVDSSVGGKTAINHPAGKNLIGAFHQPELVWVNLKTLSTLEPAERTAGLAEVLKMAVCLDAVLLDTLESVAEDARAGDPFVLEHLVAMSVRAKAGVVALDEREHGARMVLNAGHTVAHGIEVVLGFGTMRHGEAVSIGLIQETRWAESNGHAEAGLTARITRIAAALGLPTELPPGLDKQALAAAMQVDKKARRDTVWVTVPTRAGASVRLGLPHGDLPQLLTSTE